MPRGIWSSPCSTIGESRRFTAKGTRAVRTSAVLAAVYFPCLDLRYIKLADPPETPRLRQLGLPRWHWPVSEELGREPIPAVGHLGSVVRRARRDTLGILRANGAVWLPNDGPWRSVSGRRILADNSGQVIAELSFQLSPAKSTDEAIEALCCTEIEVRGSGRGLTRLVRAGFTLAERYLVNSAQTAEPDGIPNLSAEMVREGEGSPFVILVADPEEIETQRPGTDRVVGPECCIRGAQVWSADISGTPIQVWQIVIPAYKRRQRIATMRDLASIIGWFQEVAIFGRICANPETIEPYSLSPGLTKDFANDRSARLRRSFYGGWPIKSVHARVALHMEASRDLDIALGRAIGPTLKKQEGNDLIATVRRIAVHRDIVNLTIIANNHISGSQGVNLGVFEGDVVTAIGRARALGRVDGELQHLVEALPKKLTKMRRKRGRKSTTRGERTQLKRARMTDSVPAATGGTAFSNISGGGGATGIYIGTFAGTVTTILGEAGMAAAKDPLAAKLTALATELDTIKERLKPEVAKTVGGDLEQLTREATGGKRPGILRTYGEAILSALAAGAAYAEPVVKLVDEVLTLAGAK